MAKKQRVFFGIWAKISYYTMCFHVVLEKFDSQGTDWMILNKPIFVYLKGSEIIKMAQKAIF